MRLEIFTMANCPPCNSLKSTIAQLKADGKLDIKIIFNTLEEARELFAAYSIRSAPTLLFIKSHEGQEFVAARKTGDMTAQQLVSWVESLME